MASLRDIIGLDSYEALSDCLNGVKLIGPQQQAVACILAKKRYILNHPTGKGKTLMASAVMKILHNNEPRKKFIFFCSKNQFIQTPQKIRSLTGLNVISISGERSCIDSVINTNAYLAYDIIIVTPEGLINDDLFSSLCRNMNYFKGIIIDEAHNFTNYYTSQVGFSLLALCRNLEYRVALTATPITRDAMQFASLCHIIDPKFCPDTRVMEKLVNNGEVTYDDISYMVLTTDKYDKNKYHVYKHYVEPNALQIRAKGEKMFEITRGDLGYNQRDKLKQIIEFEGEGRGIIYIRLDKILQPTIKYLEENNISFAVINGKTKDSDRSEIIKKFYDGCYKVVITDITTSLDIEADYVIFYEFTCQVKQLIGRAQRGLDGKELNIHFLFTENTDEEKWFREHILSLSELLKTLLNDDYEEVRNMSVF